MLEEADRLPQVYDEDCPELTADQLAEFRPVNFATMEERAAAMRAMNAERVPAVVDM